MVQPIGRLSISDPSLGSDAILYYSSDYYTDGSYVLRFVRLDSDGNLRIYSSTRGSCTTDVKLAAVLDQRRVLGYYGDLSICNCNDSNLICGCPSQNFELIDPSDSRKGCKRKVGIVDCPGTESTTMLQLDHPLFSSEEVLIKFLNWENLFNIALGTARGITYRRNSRHYGMVLLEIVSGRRNF
ncbi:hypothetical protein SAY87_001965 [Trapa incisa]|uniref:Uncharacterized protein n=1 Tax=Trapa incisa TaxID=236973 RepID=A0AAN7JT64_9MYRT|nr:hypothetical protein SAY87_001965 [Trapa incisa]